MIDLKFGKKPATTSAKDFKFSELIDKSLLPTTFPHLNFGYGTRFKNWGMLGNDEVGDCVIASRAHLTMLDTSVGAPATARFTTASVIGEYGAVTGYDPSQTQPDGSNPTDQGTDMRVMCSYQRKTGLLDADGKRHQIGAYLTIAAGNTLEQLQAIWVFGGFCMGFEVPESAMEQFDAGQIWDDVGDTNILGGHEICGVGTMDWHTKETFVTWGKRQEATLAFIEKYNDENWVYVSPEILSAGGTYRGLNIAQLNADLAAL